MPYTDIHTLRFSVASRRPFQEVVGKLTAAVGQPDMREFHSGLMEFVRFDAGEVLRRQRDGQGLGLLRLIVGDPLVMKEMARTVPDTASYAPVTILIAEQADGVVMSYDSAASLIAPYGSKEALAVATGLDARIERLLETAAR